MGKTGILLHVYNLGSADWERLVWGDPAHRQMGTGAKLYELLMSEPPQDEVHTVLYEGPSRKAGLYEGAYTLRYINQQKSDLDDFPRLKAIYEALGDTGAALLEQRINNITVGERINNTAEEIQLAAERFTQLGVSKVIHIAAASHAPRCIQLQAVARQKGWIPLDQQWFTVAGDTGFAGTVPSDVVVVEPPHRADDPLLTFKPTLASVLRNFYALAPADKKLFIRGAETLMRSLVARDLQTKIKDITEQ